MVRIVTQLLVGFMLIFGAVMLTPKLLLMVRQKNAFRGIYYLMLWSISVIFSVMAFYYALHGILHA